MKGVREPLTLIASGLFLCAFLTPFTGVLGFAGIALGMSDLRGSSVGTQLGWSRVTLSIAAWCSCAAWVLFFFHPKIELPQLLLQALTIGGTGLALSRLAGAARARRLGSVMLGLCWMPLAFVPLVLLEKTVLAVVLWTVAVLALAIAALRLCALAGRFGMSTGRPKHS